jgi:hypothetical protein
MVRVFAIAAVIVLLGIEPSSAQMGASPTPGAGTTSPLGTLETPIGGSGVPLGSTELYVGGLSPALVGPADSATGTGFPTATGLSSVPGSSAITSSVVTSLGGANIPLGATDLDSAGLSPPTAVPVPSASSSLCPGTAGVVAGSIPALGSANTTGTASGMSLPFGCP